MTLETEITGLSAAHAIHIRRGGRDFAGQWLAVEDKVLVVSPYGLASAPQQPGEAPQSLAEAMLGEMAFRWCAQEFSEARQIWGSA